MKAIRLNYRGQDYVIPAGKAFEVGAEVEEIVTLGEIGTWGNKVPFFKVARCFGTMLRFAGASVTDEAVFRDLMGGLQKIGKAKVEGDAPPSDLLALSAVQALVACLMNGAPESDEEAEPEKPTAS